MEQFNSITNAKKFLQENGVVDLAYNLLKKEIDENYYFDRFFVKKLKVVVCEVCNCIRREVIIIESTKDSTKLAELIEKNINLWLPEDKKCSNPICNEYKDYYNNGLYALLKFHQWIELFEIKGRLNEFDILNKLRFYGGDPDWLIRDVK